MLPISIAIDSPLPKKLQLVGMEMTNSSTIDTERDVAKYSRSLSA